MRRLRTAKSPRPRKSPQLPPGSEFFVYNITDEVVHWWGGAAEQVAKGSFSMPREYGFGISKKF